MFPGICDVTRVTKLDIVVISLISAAGPFCGNIILVAMLNWASLMIASQSARRRPNVVTGVVLFIVTGLTLIL